TASSERPLFEWRGRYAALARRLFCLRPAERALPQAHRRACSYKGRLARGTAPRDVIARERYPRDREAIGKEQIGLVPCEAKLAFEYGWPGPALPAECEMETRIAVAEPAGHGVDLDFAMADRIARPLPALAVDHL